MRLLLLSALCSSCASEQGADVPCVVPLLDGNPEELAHCAIRRKGGEVALQEEAKRSISFDENGLAGMYIDTECYWVNRAGTVRKTLCFDNGADYFSEGLTRHLGHDGKFGFMDASLRIVIEPTFDFAGPFKDGRASTCTGCKAVADGEHSRMEGGTWGEIDRMGNVLGRALSHP